MGYGTQKSVSYEVQPTTDQQHSGKISPKSNSKLKFWKISDFGGFQLPEVREKRVKNCQICIFSFHHVAKHIEGWLKNFTLFLFYSQIWLNLPRDDCQSFYSFQWMIATLATNKNSFKKNNWWPRPCKKELGRYKNVSNRICDITGELSSNGMLPH